MFVCLTICMSISLYFRLLISLYLCTFGYLHVHSAYMSQCLFISLSISSYVCVFLSLIFFFCPSIFLKICSPPNLPVFPYFNLSVHQLSVCPSVSRSVHLSTSLFVHLSVHQLSVCPSVSRSVHLSTSLSVHLSVLNPPVDPVCLSLCFP